MKFYKPFFLTLLLLPVIGLAQDITSDQVIPTNKIVDYLKPEVKAALSKKGVITEAVLAQYFRDKFAERYFYNWNDFDSRFKNYNTIYKGIEKTHTENALDHLSKFSENTPWKLPFNYLNGSPVNAYAMRHLARQHKMVDIAFYFYYQNKDPKYIDYFKNQLQSLNGALKTGKYESIEDGNGVYEVFRSGYRILNWLEIHNMFLGQKAYSDKDQLITIATLLQHGENLYENNATFQSGNHQTRGMSALAMLSILFRDFKGTDKWYDHAMSLLEAHMTKEINSDGFQFERTVHYHMSDIETYLYVYQLAKISKIEVKPFWEEKLKSLFVTLTKIGYPDKSGPVLSDDTDDPWAEKNDISGALTLGYLLFKSPEMGYFANHHVEPFMFWYFTESQLKMLDNVVSKPPLIKEAEFPKTGYYIMREGWMPNDKMMIVSAGLDDLKPDHQHGDMLGIQAMANGKVILPNYQVRYSLNDFEFFKNSMVKNVALVDDELQGQQYTSNQGGSGFGKFLKLPQPKTIAWKNNKDIDVFIGRHDGFENVGVQYSRQVVYLKDDCWIVKDNFSSDKAHDYKQVWQGHYTMESSPNLIHSSFDDASGLDIYQIRKVDTVLTSGKHGKQWSVVSKKNQTNFSFITVLYPYKGYSNSIEKSDNPKFKEWELNKSKWKIEGVEPISLTKDEKTAFFSVNKLELKDIKINFSAISDMFLTFKGQVLTIQSIGEIDTQILFNNKDIKKNSVLKPGDTVEYVIK
ncbi:hypothetical protein ADIARSV_1919 [Arcticibacter svalbardensis MN12-7]|uniref:Uncharacterized protein n=1 Tax=Arcticibacter svalbardensis MN12-7 TaxID=1150600 RepID=R9GTK3_9SPHI|nr:heparinase II/III family protein [Arcticibacter svalbardensis]EOR94885.1 hypothetical protein ADIARSV_1919 [Arcticibacter svalbardensis MN12-7]